MVQLMNSMKRSAAAAGGGVKLEFDDPQHVSSSLLHKRSKLDSSSQHFSVDSTASSLSASEYNPLDEPSPLGLRLKKSPSFLDLIQMRLSQENVSKKSQKGGGAGAGAGAGGVEKLKASNFPASVLKIGTWEYKSRYEGDLVAKCYFAKHKLVWEVLDGGLKNKIEIQWSDIMAIKATFSDDGPDTLDVVLGRQPLFFRETNPQPRKHTLWQATSDFTGGQASVHRQHFLLSPRGLLGKHFEKLIQCDPRLCFLSQQPEIILESPYFEMRVPAFDDPKESGHASFGFPEATSSSGTQTSSRNEYGNEVRAPEHLGLGSISSGSAMDNHTIEDISSGGIGKTKLLSDWENVRVPGLHPSMSMSDLVSRIGHRITEQITSTNPAMSRHGGRHILEDVTQFLLGDSELMSASNEQALLSRVNSLCCLLQKDPETLQNIHFRGSLAEENFNSISACQMAGFSHAPGAKITENASFKQAMGEQPSAGISRNDSVGELLLNLPRIASLPQFLHINADDNQAR